MRRYDINPLYRYFTKVMGKENVDKLFSLYRVGTSRRWGGATVFWQIDRNSNVRAGKIMGYDAVTGHRIKEPFNQVSWVHSVRKVHWSPPISSPTSSGLPPEGYTGASTAKRCRHWTDGR